MCTYRPSGRLSSSYDIAGLLSKGGRVFQPAIWRTGKSALPKTRQCNSICNGLGTLQADFCPLLFGGTPSVASVIGPGRHRGLPAVLCSGAGRSALRIVIPRKNRISHVIKLVMVGNCLHGILLFISGTGVGTFILSCGVSSNPRCQVCAKLSPEGGIT